MYLTDEAVFETLRFVATLPPGSEIAFNMYCLRRF
jgi:O-methyltransferase involved in polyketide biosynthesis